MAINIFRAQPSRWVPIIQETYRKNPTVNTKSQQALINCVKSMEKMPGISFDDGLNAAVRKNNIEVVTPDTRNVAEGGNIKAL